MPPSPKQPGRRAAFVPPRAAAYAAAGRRPATVASVTGEHNQLGFASVSLRINPLRYEGSSRTLFLVTDVTITLDCELPFIKPTIGSRRQWQEAAALTQLSVINPEAVDGPTVATAESPTPTTVDYLIITTNTLVSGFTALANHRQAHNGFTTEILTVQGIRTNYAGADTQQRIPGLHH